MELSTLGTVIVVFCLTFITIIIYTFIGAIVLQSTDTDDYFYKNIIEGEGILRVIYVWLWPITVFVQLGYKVYWFVKQKGV